MYNTISEELIDNIINAIKGIYDTWELVNPKKKVNVKKVNKKVDNLIDHDEDENHIVEEEKEDVLDEKRIERINKITKELYEHAKKLLDYLYNNFKVLYPDSIEIHETTFFKNYIPENHTENDYLNHLIEYVPRYFKENQNLLKSREDRQQYVTTFLIRIAKHSPAIRVKSLPNPVTTPVQNEELQKTEDPFYNEVLARLDEPFQTIMRSKKDSKSIEEIISDLKVKGFDYPERLVIIYTDKAKSLIKKHGESFKLKIIKNLVLKNKTDQQIQSFFHSKYGRNIDVEIIIKVRKLLKKQ